MLASHSFAYAPLYWAKAINLGGIGKHSFHYPKRSAFSNGDSNDPVISSLYSNGDDRADVVVCDPCRMVFLGNDEFDQLMIAGTFIRRSMFSVVTKSPNDTIDYIISPPRGMTGYMVAAEYLYTTQPDLDPDSLKSRILAFGSGSWEKERYDAVITKGKISKRPDICNRLGFVTPDIRVAASLSNHEGYRVLDKSPTKPETAQMATSSGAMTCFITTRAKLNDSTLGKEIKQFLATMCAAISEIREGVSYRAAFDLVYDYQAARILYPKKPKNKDQSISNIQEMLKILTAKKPLIDHGSSFHYYCDQTFVSRQKDVNWEEKRVEDIIDTQSRLLKFREILDVSRNPVVSKNMDQYLDSNALKEKIVPL